MSKLTTMGDAVARFVPRASSVVMGAAHPSPVQGYYNRDREYSHDYNRLTQTVEGSAKWIGTWVVGVKDRAGYLQKLGKERRQGLQLKEHRYVAPVDYGCWFDYVFKMALIQGQLVSCRIANLFAAPSLPSGIQLAL